MPSRAFQGVRIITRKDPKTGRYILISRKTGFMDVWIGGQHFYYNYTNSYNDSGQIDINQAVDDYNSQTPKKQTIVIRRK